MNRRKIILLSVSTVLLSGAAYLGLKMWTTLKQKDKISATIQQLPSLPLRKMDGSVLNTSSFQNSQSLVVLNYFNPDCDHCQSMVQELFREERLLQNVNWLMITSSTMEKTKRFADSMKLHNLSAVTVLCDTAFLFTKTFASVSVPSFYVYKEGKLLRKHNGECSVAYLLQP
jgi:peroxiredoxin